MERLFPDDQWVNLDPMMHIHHPVMNLLHAILHMIHPVIDHIWIYSIHILHQFWAHLQFALRTLRPFIISVQPFTASKNFLGLMAISAGLIVSLGIFASGRKILMVLGLFFAVTATVDWVYSSGNFYYHVLGFGYTLVLLAALHIFMVEGDLSFEIDLVFRALDIVSWGGGLNRYTANRLEQRQQRRRRRKYARRVVVTQSPEEDEEQAAKFKRLVERCEKARILAYPLDAEENNGDDDNEEEFRMPPEAPLNPFNSLEEPDYIPEDLNESFPRDLDLDLRSARYLLQWLSREIHESEGFVVPVKWSQVKKTGKIECYNGYNNVNRPVEWNFFANSDDLIIGSVSVLQPAEIRPAMLLIDTALEYVRFYDCSKFENEGQETLRSHSQFRRTVAVKCEFKRYPAEYRQDSGRKLDVDNPKWVENPEHEEEVEGSSKKHVGNGSGKTKGVYVDKDRELVSLLTISVDRFLVVTFHLGYMLQYPTPQTCQELQAVFEDLIFNKRLIKIWHNVADSIAALDATLEHIFRGRRPPDKGVPDYQTALKQYRNSARKPFRETENSPLRYPHYKDTGPDTYLDVNRPASLEFERMEKPCPLGFHGPGVDYAGRRCPCYLGILDITSILDFILRQHCFIPSDPTANPQRFANNDVMWPELGCWAEPRKDCSFSRLTQWMLAGSKYQPLLCRFKTKSNTKPKKPDAPGLQGVGAEETMNIYNMQMAIYNEKPAQWYTAFGKTNGIERDEICLSYIVGDAIGLGLMFRYLLTTESPRLIAERLSHYGYREPLKIEPFAYETALYRPPLDTLRLRPLEQTLSYTIGLEVDVRSEEEEMEYLTDEIYTKLANRPWWYMRKDTHWTAVGTYANVIEITFQRTGWEFPIPPESEQREIRREGNYDQPISCRNLVARILRNNSVNLPDELREIFRRATYLSNAVWFSAFVSLLEWHCGLLDLNLPLEDLAIIYNDAAPVPAEVRFRREFAEYVRVTGTRTRALPPLGNSAPPPPPRRRAQPETPPRIRVSTGQTPTPSPQQPTLSSWWNRTSRQEPTQQLPPTLWQLLRSFSGGRPQQSSPLPQDDQPPEGYVVRTSKTTGRLFWWNRERNHSIWPDRPAALAAERRAADATAAAQQAATNASNELANAVTAEESARGSAVRAANAAANRRGGTVVARQAAGNYATTAQWAAEAATRELADVRAAAVAARQESYNTIASLRVGNPLAAENAAQRGAAALVDAQTAAGAVLRYANDAEAAARQALGATAVAAAAAAAAQQRADAARRAADDRQLEVTAATEALRAANNAVDAHMGVFASVTIPVGEAFAPRQRAVGLVSWPVTQWAANAARRSLTIARDLERAADRPVTNPDALAAARLALRTLRSTRILRTDINDAINNLYITADQPLYNPVSARAAAVVLAAVSVTASAAELVLAAFRDAHQRSRDAVTAAELAVGTAANDQQVADAAAAAAAALAANPEPEPDFGAVSTIIPIPEQHRFMDGVCAEILIYMLVQEISQYEALDSDRRMFLGFEKMEKDYNAFANCSLWDHAAVRLMMEEAGLDGSSFDHLSYKEPYWFKRLQVLLGHDFACCTALNSPDTTICQQCGAGSRHELLEMLIAELERIKKLAETQIKLRDAYSRIYHEARQELWMWIQFQSPKKLISPDLPNSTENNRVGVNPETEACSSWTQLFGLWNLWGSRAPSTAPPATIPRTQHENEWIMPPWCKCLLKVPLDKERRYPKPSVRRLHRDWLQATIILLHVNPEAGPDTWECLRKWWKIGLRIQATAFADEDIHQFDLPSLALIREDNPEPMPNFGINQLAVDARRNYSPEVRQAIAAANIADYTIARNAARARPDQP